MTLEHLCKGQDVQKDKKKANLGSESGPDQQQNMHAQGAEEEEGDAPAKSERHQQDMAEQQDHEPPFSVFGAREKSFIVMIASLAALFSPLSTNVYYPALNTLSRDLHASLSKINLTITTYLVRSSHTSLAPGAERDTDLSGVSTSFRWKPFRRGRPTNFLYYLLHRIYRCQYWSRKADELSFPADPTYDPELRK